MNTATLKKRLDSARGPFASIYVDDSKNTEDSGKARELQWRTVLDELRKQEAPDELVARVLDLADRKPPIGSRGRALVVGESGVIVDEELPVVPALPDVRFSVMPHLLPLFEFGAPEHTILLAEVDRTGVDVSFIDEYGRALDFDSEDMDRHPIHKANVGDRFSWAHVEERTEEMIDRNYRDTATYLARVVRQVSPSMLVISGEVQARTGIERLLPDDVKKLTHAVPEGGRADGADHARLADAINEIVQQRRTEKVAEALERFRIESGRASGFAVDGMRIIAANVQQANVDTLLVARPSDETQPAPVDGDSREEDAVIAAAIHQGSDVIVCKKDDVKFRDGFGAILRAPALDVSDQ
ncbi:hypothetical protein [Hoyosella altamirensis]|uniref:Peptide chain release factor 1 n=1 Tax=Hoyosella altamirensis TaxID=616997 RepID=A0A839RP64_9ACTN|nr:hypothetical protein [Hoyosella altamirensis]MBB3038792.1 hypothetical protein [Hoyosella altamirensis]